MEINVNGQILNFIEIPLFFAQFNIENVYYQYRIRTLERILELEQYLGLNHELMEQYNDFNNTQLGVFLQQLKEMNDPNYKLFLNPYGDNTFCNFSINEYLNDKGLYCFIQGVEIKYLGSCTTNFNKRINDGYGSITPANCLRHGQPTNCKVNSRLNDIKDITLGIFVMNEHDKDEIRNLERNILNIFEYEWNRD